MADGEWLLKETEDPQKNLSSFSATFHLSTLKMSYPGSDNVDLVVNSSENFSS